MAFMTKEVTLTLGAEVGEVLEVDGRASGECFSRLLASVLAVKRGSKRGLEGDSSTPDVVREWSCGTTDQVNVADEVVALHAAVPCEPCELRINVQSMDKGKLPMALTHSNNIPTCMDSLVHEERNVGKEDNLVFFLFGS
ncbi:conserved hypothetical protein [Ricinus communis]|uniref:Uncharacterized protein n=1 Tax=Ricinus communis TaxID=3988 RepID=B9SCB7_RICCO|nr:conserved hypothetical protein [Ricinus communis]